MFFICDKEGFIFEISENCKTILGLDNRYLHINELRTEHFQVNISELFPEINISRLNRQDSNPKGFTFSKVHEISFQANLEIVKKLKYGAEANFIRARYANALGVVFQESFHSGLLEMNIVAVKIFEEVKNQYER